MGTRTTGSRWLQQKLLQVMSKKVRSIISASISVKQAILDDEQLLQQICDLVEVCVNAFRQDRKMLLCGNGGSAADAQHIAAELSGRFYQDRPPLYAEALHVNSSYLTAVANDYNYHSIYERMVQAAGRKGDILLGLSTSGNSENVCRALERAREQGMICVGLTGEQGGKMRDLCDHLIRVPSTDTPRIQESHIMVGHILCELIERKLFTPR